MNKLVGAACLVWTVFATAAVGQIVDKVVAAHYPPLMVKDDVDQPGYAVEVLREAARRAGREVEVTFLPFQRAMEALKKNSASLMPALFYGEQRAPHFRWVSQIQSAKLVFATTSQPVNSIEDARALKSIVVEQKSTSDVMLSELGFDNLIRVVSPTSSARMLATGRVEAWFQTQTIIHQMWARVGLANKPLLGKVVHMVPIYMVASRSLPIEVEQAYQKALQSMKDDGTFEVLWAKYN